MVGQSLVPPDTLRHNAYKDEEVHRKVPQGSGVRG
jgi:hypothetical protein